MSDQYCQILGFVGIVLQCRGWVKLAWGLLIYSAPAWCWVKDSKMAKTVSGVSLNFFKAWHTYRAYCLNAGLTVTEFATIAEFGSMFREAAKTAHRDCNWNYLEM